MMSLTITQTTILSSMQILFVHTHSTAYFSRVWTPPIPSAHSSYPSLWNQTLVTPVKHLWTLCCVSVALQRSIPGGNRGTTANWSKVFGDIMQASVNSCLYVNNVFNTFIHLFMVTRGTTINWSKLFGNIIIAQSMFNMSNRQWPLHSKCSAHSSL